MFNQKPGIKMVGTQKNGKGQTPKPSNERMFMYAAGGLGVLAFVFLILFVTQMGKTNTVTKQARAMSAKIKDLQEPKYDLVNDFITDQCGTNGAYCMDTVTNNPGIEILKFLVNFRENPELKYRLFFQVDANPNAPTVGYKLDCEPRESDFYICQQITTARPTDVIRAFQRSYSSFTPSVNYNFTLMVKPVGKLDYPSQVSTVNPPPMKQGAETPAQAVQVGQPQAEQQPTAQQPQPNTQGLELQPGAGVAEEQPGATEPNNDGAQQPA